MIDIDCMDSKRMINIDRFCYNTLYAGMAELVDAQDSKSCESNLMWVQAPLPADYLDTLDSDPY